MSTLDISRIQFAITITFHIIFPALSIGLASYIVLVEALFLKTSDPIHYQTCRFWTKVLALTFGMGIISGLVMEFQLGTNWSGFSEIVGPVLGVLFVSETLTAFFIEATFLGFMIFGWGRINKYFHFFCTFMVWFGVMLSAFWILAANSWMQTPDGVRFSDQQFFVTSWLAVIFNHSTLVRYSHMVLAAYTSALMIIIAVSCYYISRDAFLAFAKFNLKLSLSLLTLIITSQMLVGDEVGLEVYENQPIKTAAIEGAWQTQPGAPLLLLADIDQEKQQNDFEIGIPHLASVINTHHWNGVLTGLTDVDKSKQPNVFLVFYSFRIMVGLGILILLFALIGMFKYWKGNLFDSSKYLKIGMYLAPSGLLAMIMGWYTAEIGRQPWVVYQLLSTSNAATNTVSFDRILIGFLLILLVYGIIFGYFYNNYLIKTIKKGPAVYQLSSNIQRQSLLSYIKNLI